jgi:hypothetical protein
MYIVNCINKKKQSLKFQLTQALYYSTKILFFFINNSLII